MITYSYFIFYNTIALLMTKKSFNNKPHNPRFNQNKKPKREQAPKFQQLSNPDIKIQHNADPIPNQKQQGVEQSQQNKLTKEKKIKHNRIIIRNLVYDINEKHLRKLLAPFGEVKQINIPLHPDRKCSKGFAFVEMSNRNMCLKAIKKLNGTLFKGRNIILDQSVAKQKYMAERLNEKNDGDQKSMEEEEADVKKEQKQEIQEEEGDEEEEEESEMEVKKEKQQDSDDDEQQEENSKEARVAQDHRSQIFIRNLPINVTEELLLKKFRKYGKVIFVKIVMNKETNTSKGTAFVKYKDPDVAEKLIEYSRGYEMYMLKKNPRFKTDPTIHLQIDGSIVKIFPVETRNYIQQKIKSRENGEPDAKKKKPLKKIKRIQDLIKTDPNGKRKLQYALEGKWRAQQEMNKFDYEKFKAHEKQKIQKLKNPNNSVSSNRLILKYLDKSITEDQIRNLSMKFLSEYQSNKAHLSYCKLMLDSTMKKSAGFAFVEFKKEEQTKAFLKKLIDNPQQLMDRPFVAEYAIQDSRKLLKLKKSKIIHKESKQKKVEGGKRFSKNNNKRFGGHKKGFNKNSKGGKPVM